MLGKLLHKFRQTFGDGPFVWWYRDIMRPRIVDSAPIIGLTDRRCEVHVLTSANDWLNLIWALKSFYHVSARRYQVMQLRKHFPDARFIDRPSADSEVIPSLAAYPRCQDFRRTNHLSPKIFDFRHYLESDRMFLLDSDVLFFEEPTELLRRIEDPQYNKNSVNGDVATAYTVKQEGVQERLGIKLIDRFNSGLGLIHRDSLQLNWIEEFLDLPDATSHFWRIEQTMFALCSCRYGVELLPKEYDVFLNGKLNGQPSRHYVGAIRHENVR